METYNAHSEDESKQILFIGIFILQTNQKKKKIL